MKKIQIKTCIAWLAAVMMVLLLFLTQTPFGTADYGKLNKVYIGLEVFMLIWVIITNRFEMIIDLKSKELYAYVVFLLPYFIMGVLSVVESLFDSDFSVHYVFRYMKVQYIVLIAVVLVFCVLKTQIIDVLFAASIVNYSVYIGYFVKVYGIRGLFQFIKINEAIEAANQGKILEVHEVTFIFGLLFMFYFMNRKIKGNKIKCVFCFIYMLFGYKRVLLGALAISVCAWIISNIKRSEKMVKILSYSTLTIVVAWLIFVLSPLYTKITGDLGINLNGRGFDENGIYGRLTGYYKLSPLYYGHGFGFVDYRMMLYKQNHPSATNGFHNDILKLYIDIGFIPTLLFFYNLIVLNAKRIGKHFSVEKALQVCCVVLLTMICWMTDNLQTYPNYVFSFFSVMLSVLFLKHENVKEKSND